MTIDVRRPRRHDRKRRADPERYQPDAAARRRDAVDCRRAGASAAAPRPRRRRQRSLPAAAPADARRRARRRGRGPRFRGDNAAGNGDGQGAVTEWNVADGRNVRWKTPIPGYRERQPDRVGQPRVRRSRPSAAQATRRSGPGCTATSRRSNDLSEHTWKIYCLDKASGKILWEQTAFTRPAEGQAAPEGQPGELHAGHRRHARRRALRLDRHARRLGHGRQAALEDATSACSTAGGSSIPRTSGAIRSSPIIYKGTVIVQADVQKGSFIAAYDLKTGKQVWRTERDEISDVGHADPLRGERQLVTNGSEDPRLRSRRPASCCGRSARTQRWRSARRSSATAWSTSPAAIRRCGQSTR